MIDSAEPMVTVVPSESGQASEIAALATVVYPGVTGWPVDQLAYHRTVFAAGQLVAVDRASERVLGASLNLIVDWRRVQPGSSYMDIIDSGWFRTHDEGRGQFLYAADLFVHPDHRGEGVGAALLAARWDLAVRLGQTGVRGSARLSRVPPPDVTAATYVNCLEDGSVHEPTVAFLVSRGARILDVLFNHFSPDQDGCPHAVLTEWRRAPRTPSRSDETAKIRSAAGRLRREGRIK